MRPTCVPRRPHGAAGVGANARETGEKHLKPVKLGAFKLGDWTGIRPGTIKELQEPGRHRSTNRAKDGSLPFVQICDVSVMWSGSAP